MLSEAERALLADAWPLHLFDDPGKKARTVTSSHEFFRELLLGNHLEDIVVLPNGVELLGLTESEAFPEWLPAALNGADSPLKFLQSLGKDVLRSHKAALEYVDDWGVQRESLPRPYPFCLWDKPQASKCAVGAESLTGANALPEAWRDLEQRLATLEVRIERQEVDASNLYVCELRRLRERPCSSVSDGATGGRASTKSVSLRHVRNFFKDHARWALYWNCYDDGIFIGGRGSGKGLHVDQVLWSNVGKQWRGHKLLAVWPAGEVSARMVAELADSQFRPPLTPRQIAALEQCAKVVLLRPGDVFLCSGGVAHVTLSISESLTVTAYESFVSLNPQHVAHFLQTGITGPGALDRGVIGIEELRDLRERIASHALDLLRKEATRAHARVPCAGLDGDLREALAETITRLAADVAFAPLMRHENIYSFLNGLLKATPPKISEGVGGQPCEGAGISKRRKIARRAPEMGTAN